MNLKTTMICVSLVVDYVSNYAHDKKQKHIGNWLVIKNNCKELVEIALYLCDVYIDSRVLGAFSKRRFIEDKDMTKNAEQYISFDCSVIS